MWLLSNIIKYFFLHAVCHAEMNAIVNKISADIQGCKMYVTLYPCNNCAKIIIQSGIKHVVYYDDKNRHKDEAKASQYMFDKAGITIRYEKRTKNVQCIQRQCIELKLN